MNIYSSVSSKRKKKRKSPQEQVFKNLNLLSLISNYRVKYRPNNKRVNNEIYLNLEFVSINFICLKSFNICKQKNNKKLKNIVNGFKEQNFLTEDGYFKGFRSNCGILIKDAINNKEEKSK